MFPIVLVIPKYLKEAKLSDSQRPIYWQWDGVVIKAKNKSLLQKYIKDNDAVILNNGKARPEHLKFGYHIAAILDGVILARIHKDINVSKAFSKYGALLPSLANN